VSKPFDPHDLAARGFVGFQPVQTLTDGCAQIPSVSGFYVVTLEPVVPGFLAHNAGGWFKREDPTVAVEQLEAKWLDGVSCQYIGRASNLRRRIELLARYGRGQPVSHRGGRYLWQLAEHKSLCVAWRRDLDPICAERELLDEFEATYGALPFANLVRGARPLVLA